MKGKKTELRIFTIADWEKEERYLQKRHQEGWKFKKLSFPVFYSFEKCLFINLLLIGIWSKTIKFG